jgi:spore coat protein A, manganese oxidase
MTISRRDLLRMGAAAATLGFLPSTASSGRRGAVRLRPFQQRLKVPPTARPLRIEDDFDLYDVVMRKADLEIIDGKRTRVWGFDGRFPGPTFKVKRGRRVVVRRRNRLGVPTTTHLHGGEVPWRSDGHPSQAIEPGEAYDYVYPNTQDAATLWYHDHLCAETSRNNYMGLSGLYIIEDDAERELNLPKDEFDIPLILQDRDFRSDGSLRFRQRVNKLLGEVYLVNGVPMPFLKVSRRKYRFRIVNASHSRIYRLALSDNSPLVQIASDQGLLSAPVPATELVIAPAERIEIVVDFSEYEVGSEIVLGDSGPIEETGEVKPVIRFDVVMDATDDSSLPSVLKPVERLLPLPGTIEREFVLSKDFDKNRWVINGKAFDARRIDIRPRLGDTEIWTFRNASSMAHPMHVHLVRFQILDRSNGQVVPGELGWKDTVRVDPSASVRIIMSFRGFPGRYMYHCHNLAHEDHSMMGQMQTVGDDEGAATAPSDEGGYFIGGSESSLRPITCQIPSR